ncbi:SCP-like extracellular protein [Phytophthora megakarya]|uniref:SCP-like extracellular protein n=1 Tax=Phytophthora megakarya TaxID=4795 RepID=A0A225VWM7_9STRA|nr:SCP-like extracellular protein [Phytophthora megakarya]
MPRISSFALVAAFAVATSISATSAFQSGSNGRVMWENNCDFCGNDYRSMRAIPDVCGDVCAGDLACTHWSWNNYNGGTCWFKTGSKATKTSKWGTNCGYVVSRNNGNSKGQGLPSTPSTTSAPSTPSTTSAPSTPSTTSAPSTPSTTSAPSTPSTSTGLSSSETSEMLDRINAYRAQNGLPGLTIDNRLMTSAALHTQDQANNCKMTHAGSNGSRLGDRIKAQGYSFSKAAENVAAGQTSVEQVMTSWWNSPGHRANILDKDVSNVGFAKVVNNGCSNYATYWTQDFGRLQ